MSSGRGTERSSYDFVEKGRMGYSLPSGPLKNPLSFAGDRNRLALEVDVSPLEVQEFVLPEAAGLSKHEKALPPKAWHGLPHGTRFVP